MSKMGQQLSPLIVTICGLFFGWLAVLLRLFVRIRMLKSFGLDDWFILLSTILFTVFGAFTVLATQDIDANATATEEAEEQEQASKYQNLCESSYTAATCALKVSIALLLLRLSQRRRYIYLLRLSIAFTVTYTVICFFLTLFQCWPVAYAWDKSILGGTCLSVAQRVGIGYAYAAMAILTDWFYAILPVFMVMEVKMNTRLKLYVTVVLGLGALACIATVMRTTFMLQRMNSSVGIAPISLIFVWTIVELSIGTIAASVATLRPLLQYFKFKGLGDNSPGNSNTWPRGHSSWHELSRVQEERAKMKKADDNKSATASEEALCEAKSSPGLTIYDQ